MAGIRAHCRACHFSIYLTEIVRSPFLDAHCPNCGRDLVESIRILISLPGNLALVPHTIVRELFEEIDWRHDEIVTDRELIQREIEALERYLEVWEELVGTEDAARGSELRGRLRRLSATLRRFPGVSDPPPDPVRSARD